MSPGLIVVILLLVFAVVVVMRTIRIVPQQTAQIVERLGSYNRTLTDGPHILVPFIDRVRAAVAAFAFTIAAAQPLTLRAGVAYYTLAVADADELLRQAEAQLAGDR